MTYNLEIDVAMRLVERYKDISDNMRTQRDALRAFLISLNIPEEEINEKQFAHLATLFSDTSYAYITTSQPRKPEDTPSID